MRYYAFMLISISMCLFLAQTTFAIQITEGTVFQPTGSNATFIIGSNSTWDRIEVHSTYLVVNNYTISATGYANVIIYNFTPDNIRFTVNASTPVALSIDNLSSDTQYTVYRRGLPAWKIQSNSSGGFGFSSDVSGR